MEDRLLTARWRVVSLVSVLAISLATATGPASAATGPWHVVRTPNPGSEQISNISFLGISSTGSTDAWGVGIDEVNALRRPLAAHWDGRAWRAVRVPLPLGRQAWFQGVFAVSPSDVWAVGVSSDRSQTTDDDLTFIEHFDGSIWSIVPSPNPGQGFGAANVLNGISGTGPDDLWAAGYDLDPATGTIELLFEHWDGTAWTASPSPTPPGGADFGLAVSAISPDDVWAVGDSALQVTRAAHWDGTAWSIVTTPSLHDGINPLNLLTGVTAVGSNDVWASGYEGNVNNQNFAQPYMLHWDGSTWSLTKLPNQGGEGSLLRGTVALSSDDVWAVGQTQELNGAILTLTERFDGTAWSIVASPNPGHLGNVIINGLDTIGRLGGTSLFALGSEELTGAGCCVRTLAIATDSG
jgi:hypothetical protein